ncbi:unnamed protein product [Cylicocyclus nassatus]|uniref:EF-hand domain-containing protein n=1 Tax=Cylicocyclus nassatus TaxID=53992 RepID=A0AA36GW80_CYLNA|nr:unnamed protein product [Cylicocyclus nassatus]
MESLTTGQTTSSLKQLITSISPARSSLKSPEKIDIERCSGISVNDFGPTAQTFIRRYFAGSKISEEVLDDLVNLCSEDENFYQIFVKSVLCNKLLDEYSIRTSYRRKLLKTLIEKLEHSGVEVLDEIYDICASAMIDTADYSYRIFLNDNFSQLLVVLRESNQQLCYGTTGLSLWQASCDLANLLCRFIDLSSKIVLELGAGCGLAGIAVARTFSGCNVLLSDYDPKVLNQLKYNVDENLKKGCSHVKVLNLDWTSFSAGHLPELPDVVIAADVVYDCSILPALCGVLRTCIYAKQGCCAYIASTLRDPLTLQSFKNCLDTSDLQVAEELRYQYEKYTFSDGSRFRCTSLFPHSSTLDAPTIIYKVVRKMMSCSSSSSTQVSRKEVEAAFAMCNEEQPHLLKLSDLKLVMRALGFDPRNAQIDQMTMRFREMQRTKVGGHQEADHMDVDEFLEILKEDGGEKDETADEMRSAFKLFDKEGKGWITAENLKQVAQELGEELSEEDLEEMIKEASKDAEGRVAEADFFAIMKRTCLY